MQSHVPKFSKWGRGDTFSLETWLHAPDQSVGQIKSIVQFLAFTMPMPPIFMPHILSASVCPCHSIPASKVMVTASICMIIPRNQYVLSCQRMNYGDISNQGRYFKGVFISRLTPVAQGLA